MKNLGNLPSSTRDVIAREIRALKAQGRMDFETLFTVFVIYSPEKTAAEFMKSLNATRSAALLRNK